MGVFSLMLAESRLKNWEDTSETMSIQAGLTKKVTEQVRMLAKEEDEKLEESGSYEVIPPYDQAKALGKTNIDVGRIAAGLPCGSEGFLLMYARWRKLNERKGRFDITKIPDVYDSSKIKFAVDHCHVYRTTFPCSAFSTTPHIHHSTLILFFENPPLHSHSQREHS